MAGRRSPARRATRNSSPWAERLAAAREILQNSADYDWLTSAGPFVILNNGVEFAVTYLVMLLALLMYGAGRLVSVDYWLRRRFMPLA